MLVGLLNYFALAFFGAFFSFASVDECVIQGLNALEQGASSTASPSRWQRVLSGKSSTSKLDDLALARSGEQTDEGLQALADYYGVPKKELVSGSPPQLNRARISELSDKAYAENRALLDELKHNPDLAEVCAKFKISCEGVRTADELFTRLGRSQQSATELEKKLAGDFGEVPQAVPKEMPKPTVSAGDDLTKPWGTDETHRVQVNFNTGEVRVSSDPRAPSGVILPSGAPDQDYLFRLGALKGPAGTGGMDLESGLGRVMSQSGFSSVKELPSVSLNSKGVSIPNVLRGEPGSVPAATQEAALKAVLSADELALLNSPAGKAKLRSDLLKRAERMEGAVPDGSSIRAKARDASGDPELLYQQTVERLKGNVRDSYDSTVSFVQYTEAAVLRRLAHFLE